MHQEKERKRKDFDFEYFVCIQFRLQGIGHAASIDTHT